MPERKATEASGTNEAPGTDETPRTDEAPAAESTARAPGTGLSLAASAYVFAVVMMGTTLPTPLYPQYEVEFGFGNTQTTVLFAIYAGGVIASLVLFGRFSEALGRRPMLAAGVILSIASAVLFMVGTNMGLLYTGRILSGLAAGIFTATGTVSVMENAPPGRNRLAASVATAANMGGLGLGILMSGLVAHFLPGPLFTPFLFNAIMLVIAGLALLIVRDRVRPNPGLLRLQLPGVPPTSRRIFLAAAPGAITGFTVCGLYSAIAPNFMGQTLHIESPAVIGTVVFLLFGSSAAGQMIFRNLADRALILFGSIAIIVSMAALILALEVSSLGILIASSVLAGLAQGLLFMTGMRAIAAATEPQRRTEATTSYFVVAYFAMSLPAIGAGLLAASAGLAGSTTIFAIGVAAVSALGLLGLRRFGARA
ncbi:MAG: MFS transporter [Brevibacterium sp.]